MAQKLKVDWTEAGFPVELIENAINCPFIRSLELMSKSETPARSPYLPLVEVGATIED